MYSVNFVSLFRHWQYRILTLHSVNTFTTLTSLCHMLLITYHAVKSPNLLQNTHLHKIGNLSTIAFLSKNDLKLMISRHG